MSNKTYDILKWVVTVVLPALLTFFGVVGATLQLPYTETVLTIGTAFVAMLSTVLGVSSVNYSKKSNE